MSDSEAGSSKVVKTSSKTKGGGEKFDKEQQHVLSENEHLRFMRSSSKVGHLLLKKDSEGHFSAKQFAAPGSSDRDDPEIRELVRPEIIQRYGKERVRASTPNGTEMVGKRHLDLSISDIDTGEDVDHKLYLLSPKSSYMWKGQVFWGSGPDEPSVWRDNLTPNDKIRLAKLIVIDLIKEEKTELLIKALHGIVTKSDKALISAMLKQLPQQSLSLISILNHSDKQDSDLIEEFFSLLPDGRVESCVELIFKRAQLIEVELAERIIENTADIEKVASTDIDYHSVPVREAMSSRGKSQNTVMGCSAVEACEKFYEKYRSFISNCFAQKLQACIEAKPHYAGGGPKTQPRYEWNHLQGHSLTPVDKDPQQVANLAGAPKWINSTQMSLIERPAKFVAKKHESSTGHIAARYKMVQHSDLLEYGDITATFTEGNTRLKLHKRLTPLMRHPDFPKPSDIAQTCLITDAILAGAAARSVIPVSVESSGKKSSDLTSEVASTVSMNVAEGAETMPKKAGADSGDRPKDELKVASGSAATAMPTAHEFDKSVLKIYTNGKTEDYARPWRGSADQAWHGTGFVIKGPDGKKYILTNGHVTDNHIYMEARLGNSDDKYEIKPLVNGYQCDLTLAEITDPELLEKVEPLELGDMVRVRQKVQAIGFPMGGDEMCTTEGIVSRIEVDGCTEGEENILQAQMDCPVNPGNSGGPVFSDGKVVGVVFQKEIEIGADNIGYLIPMPVIQHFLTDCFSGQEYKGFPTLAISTQTLENKALKEHFGLKGKETGVRIKKIDHLSPAKSVLQRDDILLSIDGIPVSNDGKVTLQETGHRIDMYWMFKRKQVGEEVTLKVRRTNSDTLDHTDLELKVPLVYRESQTRKVEASKHDEPPTYFIANGVVFQPVTQNYLDTGHGAELADEVIPGEGKIHDIVKKQNTDQLIVVNRVLKGNKTNGYEDMENEIVSKVNGVEINNMAELVPAIMENHHPDMVVELMSGDLIVVKRQSQEEERQLLERYTNGRYCSADVAQMLEPYYVAADEEAMPLDVVAKSKGKGKAKLRSVADEEVDAETIGSQDTVDAAEEEEEEEEEDADLESFVVSGDGDEDDEEVEESSAASHVSGTDSEASSDEEEEDDEDDDAKIDIDPKALIALLMQNAARSMPKPPGKRRVEELPVPPATKRKAEASLVHKDTGKRARMEPMSESRVASARREAASFAPGMPPMLASSSMVKGSGLARPAASSDHVIRFGKKRPALSS